MSEYKGIIENYKHSARLDEKGVKIPIPEPPTFKDVIRIAEELSIPTAGVITLFDLIGREDVVTGLRVQGEEKFKENY